MTSFQLNRDMQADAALVLWATGQLDTLDIAHLTGMREAEVCNAIARAKGTAPSQGQDAGRGA